MLLITIYFNSNAFTLKTKHSKSDTYFLCALHQKYKSTFTHQHNKTSREVSVFWSTFSRLGSND